MQFNPLAIFSNKNDGKQLTQYLAVISATITLFTTGIYQGWGSPSLVKILSDEYPIEITEDEASYITIIGALGHVTAGFLASQLSDRIGRKSTIIGIAIPQILSFALIFMSNHSKILLYVARVLGGMGEGASLALVPCYVAEIAEPNVRGTLGAFTTVTINTGVLFINVIGSYLTIHQTALVCLIFPVVFWFTFILMPESPYYCLMKEDYEGAKAALQVLRRKINVDKEVEQLAVDVKRQMSEKGSFADLVKIPSNRKALIIAVSLRFFQIFTGMGAFMSYNQIMVSETTSIPPVLGSSLLLVGNLTMILISSTYIDKLGRRPMFIISTTMTFIFLYSQAIFTTIRDYTFVNVSQISWLPLLIIFLYNVAYCGGIGPGVNVFIGEIFSASVKSKALSVCSVIFATSIISSTKLYQFTADNIGMAVPFYIFGSVTLVGAVFMGLVLPETKGKSLEEIQQIFKENERKEDLS